MKNRLINLAVAFAIKAIMKWMSRRGVTKRLWKSFFLFLDTLFNEPQDFGQVDRVAKRTKDKIKAKGL